MLRKIDNKFIKAGCLFINAVLIVQLAGCGTILYPERKGQKSGRIDAGVAVLDGIGLLLFIIPGVITDIIGVILLLVPISKQNANPTTKQKEQPFQQSYQQKPEARAANDDVIEGEFVEIKDDK